MDALRFCCLISVVCFVPAFAMLYDDLHLFLRNNSKLTMPRTSLQEPLKVYVRNPLAKITPISRSHLRVNSGFYLNWKDPRLAWNPEDYNNITNTAIIPDYVWRPDVKILNGVDKSATESTRLESIFLRNDGSVYFIPSVSFTVSCEATPGRSYYDRQCAMKFGSWIHDVTSVDLQYGEKEVDLSEYAPHPRFRISNVKAIRIEQSFKCCPYPFVEVHVKFTMTKK